MTAIQGRKTITPQMLGTFAVFFLIACFFWNTIFLYPIKVFVVILHEFSHGLAAIATGGEIVGIEINEHIGGLCYTRGGNRFIVAGAGYLGSIFWGGLILIIAARTKYDKALAVIIGGGLILLAALYIRTSFGFLFTAAFGAALILTAKYAPYEFTDMVMKFLGMISCLYVIIDIKSDLIDRTDIGSDADAIAEIIGFQSLSVPIGFVWIAIAIASLCLFLKVAAKGEAGGEP